LSVSKGRLDPLADAAERAEARRLVAPVGTQDARSQRDHELLKLPRGKALVADEGLSRLERALEKLGRDHTLGGVGGSELESDRHPVPRAQEIKPEAPEVAMVRATVAVAGDPGEPRAAYGLARGRARHWRRVEQAQAIAEGG
jgi:hypothetical protein